VSITTDFQQLGDTWESRFWKRVQKRGPDDCWLWQGCTDGPGYGMVRLGSRAHRSHRIAYLLTNGDFWGILLHSCDTPACCNPRHLTPGTHADNCRDRDAKGRHVALKGSSHGGAVLTDEQVIEMRSLFDRGMSRKNLAKKFKVSYVHTCQILARNAWSHLE
jgi:hypothetical protein